MHWDRQNQFVAAGFVIAGFVYSGVCFPIFYCYSARLSNVVRYNGVFVIARFVIARCHCTYIIRRIIRVPDVDEQVPNRSDKSVQRNSMPILFVCRKVASTCN